MSPQSYDTRDPGSNPTDLTYFYICTNCHHDFERNAYCTEYVCPECGDDRITLVDVS